MVGIKVFGKGEGYIWVISSLINVCIVGGIRVEWGFNKILVFNVFLLCDFDVFDFEFCKFN